MLHDPENLSGHSPMYLKFDLVKANIAPEIRHRNPRINWSRSSQEQISGYVNQLTELLSNSRDLFQSLECLDPLCSNSEHQH